MYIRFDFEDTKEGIERFFSEELKQLIETLSMLFLTGWEIESIDLPNKKILLKQVTELPENVLETDDEIDNNSDSTQQLGTCTSCTHYNSAKSWCSAHGYSTRPADTCKKWTN